jgi:hypothetical protein
MERAVRKSEEMVKIKQIHELEEDVPVYNMFVESVNCYAVTDSNIILHNCDALRYGCMYMQPKSKISDATRIVGF